MIFSNQGDTNMNAFGDAMKTSLGGFVKAEVNFDDLSKGAFCELFLSPSLSHTFSITYVSLKENVSVTTKSYEENFSS